MIKEFIIATTLTLVFSIGIGVLFVRTVYELLQMFVSDKRSNRMSDL